ncbi:unnamed protein product [Psylliodes chrysocephalus]|uniref:Uncharacterized protein n=1 Tax=Psylliodes chrysocephalus TaxID=3402493 RepID=A0A9P0GAE9_9CUCU|nr:unnamed protein product [Psylliodes chrysocephala]
MRITKRFTLDSMTFLPILSKVLYSKAVAKQPSYAIMPKAKQATSVTKTAMIQNINPVSSNINITKVVNVRDGGIMVRCENSDKCTKFKKLADEKLVNDYLHNQRSSCTESSLQDHVGYYTGSNTKIDDDLKYKLLKSPWMPQKTFKFPVYNKSQPNLIGQIDSGYLAQIAENRKRLIPIIETIKLCERQEGTCDSGPIKINDAEPETNDGNLRAYG